MKDMHFPTVDHADPYRLSPEEESIMERLEKAFLNCEKLQQHMRFLLAREACIRYIIKTSSITAAFPFVRTEA